jgi:hypothetical protein
MSSSDRQPWLYVLDIDYHDKKGQKYIKIGTTWNYEKRKKSYITYSPKTPMFRHLLLLDIDEFPKEYDLYALDKKISAKLTDYRSPSGGQEWYKDSVSLDTLLMALKLCGVKVKLIVNGKKCY